MTTRAIESRRWRVMCDGCDEFGDWELSTAGAIVESLADHDWARIGPGEHLCPECLAGGTVD